VRRKSYQCSNDINTWLQPGVRDVKLKKKIGFSQNKNSFLWLKPGSLSFLIHDLKVVAIKMILILNLTAPGLSL
jgi:hypothetical protein